MSSLVYIVKASKLELKITLVEVDKLYIHEEIIPKILSSLVEKIKNDGVWTDPIIVDEKTMIVLDGVHRVAAAEKLGFKYIPVCLVDYDNPSIELHTWSRVFKPTRRESGVIIDYLEVFLRALNASSYRSIHIPSLDIGFKMLNRRDLLGVLIYGKRIIGLKTPSRDIKIIYDHVKRIENIAVNKGFTIEYYTEQDALSQAKIAEGITLIPPTIKKDEVRAIVLRGEVFAHKATRHVIPTRPLRINIPLKWLTGELNLEAAQRELLKHLSERKIKILPPGTILDRRYEEELYIFE
ncbi:MAG: ParB N-terminal domain-containing protein [Desulfurococcaceae archaeon]|nr:ParB N-terminal domain-containing protein [Desulfurococcaceae archaeon]